MKKKNYCGLDHTTKVKLIKRNTLSFYLPMFTNLYLPLNFFFISRNLLFLNSY